MNNDTLLIQRSTMPVDRVVAGNDKISIVNPRSITYLKAFGKCEQRNLPPEYTELEYIQSSNNAYIDTGIILPSDYERVVAKFSAEESNSNWRIFGCQSDSVCSLVPWPAGGSSNPLGYLAVGASWYLPKTQYDTISTSLNTPYEMDVIADNGNVSGTYCGEVFSKTYDDQLEQSLTITLFRNHGQNTITGSGGRLYYFKLWTSANTLAFNGIPAKNASNVIGMYDTVTSTFFTNQGTGSFIPGPNAIPTPDKPIDIICNNGVLKARHQSGLPIGYTLLDYIQSTGTQYIDTQFTMNQLNNIDLELIISNLEDIRSVGLFGAQIDQTRTLVGFNNQLYACNGQNRMAVTYPTQTLNPYSIKAYWREGTSNSGKISGEIDNVVYPETIQNGQFANDTCMIFNIKNGAGSSNASMRVHKFSIKENNIYNRYMLPAQRISDSVLGMYDIVSEQFFTNAGTGDFVAGNEVSDPIEFYTQGNVETVNLHRKNLFDATKATTLKLINDSGSIISDSVSAYSDYIKAEYNKSYTVSFSEQPSSSAFYTRIHMYDRNKVWIGMAGKSDSAGQQTFSATISNPDCYYIRVSSSKDVNLEQVEEGVENTAYESYYSGGDIICENLLSIGDYIDYQEILSGNIYRNVGIRVLDGTETWSEKDQYGRVSTSVSGIKQGSVRTIQLYCNYFENLYHSEPIENVVAGKFYSSANNIYFHITQNNVEDFKSWLSQQYTAGTPVIIVYPLASPIEEFAESQSITSKSGTNIVEVVESEIDNLDLEIRYRQK